MKPHRAAVPWGGGAREPPMFKSIDHVAVHCSDLERSVRFYPGWRQAPPVNEGRQTTRLMPSMSSTTADSRMMNCSRR
ncbi:MAG: hypothetical protein GEU76_14410 [Alphaproteobacteria bacterium]|nr:hypothetical protein [Alphaproteobacteria bacterium]